MSTSHQSRRAARRPVLSDLPVAASINVRKRTVTFWHEWLVKGKGTGKGQKVTVTARTRDGLRSVWGTCVANGVRVVIVGR